MTTSPGFFATIGQPLLFGRDFTAADRDTAARVVIVNETLARRLFGVANAVGEHLATSSEGVGETYEIVGVVKDARYGNPRQPAGMMTPLAALELRTCTTRVVRREVGGGHAVA